MLVQRRLLALFAPLTLAGSLLGAAGCGGISTGDHVFYRVAVEASKKEAGCYADKMIPENEKDDTTTFRGGATFILYLPADDDAQLDTGSLVLSGAATDAGYSFTGDDVNVEYLPGKTINDSDHDGIDDSDDMMIDADKDGLDDKTDPTVDVDADGLDDRFDDNLVDANDDNKDDRIVEIPSGTKVVVTTTVTVDMTVDGSTVSGTSTTVTDSKCEGTLCTGFMGTSCTQTSTFKGVEVEQAAIQLGAATP
jgi:hypothetical protein